MYLLLRPQEHIRDYFVKERFSPDFSHATVTVELELSGRPQVEAALLSPSGEQVGKAQCAQGEPLVFELDNPVLWNAETPAQYTLTLRTPGEVIPQKVGLRKMEVQDLSLIHI